MSARPVDNLRKLAAIDIVFLGYKIIVAEYACGVLLSAALGIFVLVRGHTLWQFLLGVYLICLGMNYLPMLIFSIQLGGENGARGELGGELSYRRYVMAKYRRVSLWLLVPLAAAFIVLRPKLSTRSE
jgi:hypothetical protein